MENKVLVENKAVSKDDTVVEFGAITASTPQWAKWMFRITLLFTTGLTLWLAGTNLISATNKFEFALILKVIDGAVYGFSKMFGIVLKDEEN